ncbi:hypothetical protein QTP86_026807 [Hemibagrus guttatus]|nr:hypothetical protein QTP86_026807 [Hemibagrus guttatus]
MLTSKLIESQIRSEDCSVPHTFTKCMDAAFAPLRLQGIRVLNCLDDWLILAHSKAMSSHWEVVLAHMRLLGLRINPEKGFHVLVHTHSTAVVAYINHQGGLRSHPLCKLVQQILLWAEIRLLSLRAIFVLGRINRESDFLLRQALRLGEWQLHPQVVESIWRIYGQAEVDLFTFEESTHCLLWYSFSHPAPLGLDTLVQTWPRLHLYTFPPVALLP